MLSLMCGASFYSPLEIFTAFSGAGDQVTGGIIISLRLPRVILSLAVGSCLALSGTVFQSILRNPLADPYIIGVSGGAALGAACAIVFNVQGPVLALAAFSGGLLVVTMVELLSYRTATVPIRSFWPVISLSFVQSRAVMLIFACPFRGCASGALVAHGGFSMARYDLLLPAALRPLRYSRSSWRITASVTSYPSARIFPVPWGCQPWRFGGFSGWPRFSPPCPWPSPE